MVVADEKWLSCKYACDHFSRCDSEPGLPPVTIPDKITRLSTLWQESIVHLVWRTRTLKSLVMSLVKSQLSHINKEYHLYEPQKAARFFVVCDQASLLESRRAKDLANPDANDEVHKMAS